MNNPSSPTSPPKHSDVESDYSDDDDSAEFDENTPTYVVFQTLDKQFQKFCEEVKEEIGAFISKLKLEEKLLVYRLLGDTLEWSESKAQKIILLYRRNTDDEVLTLTKLLFSCNRTLCPMFIDILILLNDKALKDFMFDLRLDESHYILDIIRFCNELDIKNHFVHLVKESSIRDVLEMFSKCDEPRAKQCRLCKAKKMKELEFRLNQSQVPEAFDRIRVPGILPLITDNNKSILTDNEPDIWTADDEQGFKFNNKLGLVFYNGSQVDMLKICDKCLVDVNRAASCTTRFDAIYHVPASQGRKEMLADLRNKEEEASHLVNILGKERIRRRLRDFCVSALEAQRIGYKRLKDEEIDRESKELIGMRMEEDEQRRIAMVNGAVAKDKKWIQNDLDQKKQDLFIMDTGANLKYHPGWDAEKGHVSKEREHPLSWRLKDTDEAGIPVTVQRAAQMFGTYKFGPEIFVDKLTSWKDKGLEGHTAYLDREAEKERIKKAQYEDFLKNTYAYVDSRMRALRRKKLQEEREAERKEEDRLAQRVRDKIERRDARLARQEARERIVMAWEDERGHCLRADLLEETIRATHHRAMIAAEIDQRQIDRFWGIPTEKHRIWLLKEKKRIAYEEEVELSRLRMLKCGLTKPTIDEKKLLANSVGSTTFEPPVARDIYGNPMEDKKKVYKTKKLEVPTEKDIRAKLKVPDQFEAMGIIRATTADINQLYPFTPPTTGGLGPLMGEITEEELASWKAMDNIIDKEKLSAIQEHAIPHDI